MARRIKVIIRELKAGTVQEQMCNQEGRDITELSGSDFDKHAKKLIERTVHRIYGPNGAMMLTGVKAKGKNAGYEGLVGHKGTWGESADGKIRLFSDAKQVLVTLETDDGKAITPVIVEAQAPTTNAG